LFIENKKTKLLKLVVILFLVSLTLSLFLTSVYALPSKIGGGGVDGGKVGSFGLQNSPSGFERRDNNNGIQENNIEGLFSGVERSPYPPSKSGPTDALANLHPTTNGDTSASVSDLQQQQQHQQIPNANHVYGCPTVVNPDTKIVQPNNCSHPHSDNTPQTNPGVVPANNKENNCAAVVHPNGADTKVVSTNGCPNNTNTHVKVNSGGTTTSSSSSLTVNSIQGSNSETTSSGGSSSSTNANTIPIANAGPNQKVHLSDRVVLDGSKSSDPTGGPLKYSWLQLAGGPVVSLSNHDKTKTTFVAPSVPANTVLTFQLIVNNGNYYSAPSFVTVTVQP
jgi:hypothetical protein